LFNGPARTGSHPGERGTPTIDGDHIYHEAPTGELICLDAKSGEKVWQTNIFDEFGAKNATWGAAESVLIDGLRLLCCPGGSKGSGVAVVRLAGDQVVADRRFPRGARPGAGPPAFFRRPKAVLRG
jgi:outer membrane protein assembly factor BamB